MENAVKHALSYDSVLHIDLNIIFTEEEEDKKVKITIENSGEGFSEDIFRQLDTNERLEQNDGQHIGINNVLNRMELLYSGNSRVDLANTAKGAIVTISIPAETLER